MIVLIALVILHVTSNIGIPITPVLAGLGVGGLAVALAAQSTIENVIGGLTLFGDRPVRVGEFCRFGDTLGTVEEIGLRSTRIRTLERTVVTVPNAEFSKMELENFNLRDQMLLHTTIGLRYETTPEQLRRVLAELYELLLTHPKVVDDPLWVRFAGFGAYSLDVEFFAYVGSADRLEFFAVREEIYLRIMDLIDEAGTGFAFPSQTHYLAQDPGLLGTPAPTARAVVPAWWSQDCAGRRAPCRRRDQRRTHRGEALSARAGGQSGPPAGSRFRRPGGRSTGAGSAGLAARADRRPGGRAPNIALPTRTWVAPSWTATSKSALMPMLS